MPEPSQLLLLLGLLAGVVSATSFFGPQAAAVLQQQRHSHLLKGKEATRTVYFENARSATVLVYWVSAGRETQVDTLKPRASSKQTTLFNHTFALRDLHSKELILAYVVTGARDQTPYLIIGADTSCVSLGASSAKKNEEWRGSPMLLSARQQVGEEANISFAVGRLQELARTDTNLAPFAWTEIGHLLLLSNKKTVGSMDGDKTGESNQGHPAAPSVPLPPFKQAAPYFYRAAMHGDESAQWTLALLFWGGLLQSTDMQRLQEGFMQELLPIANPGALARAGGSGGGNSGSGAMLWPERIGTTWAQCASTGGSNSAKMALAFRYCE
jgi:hypothetical protein